MKFFLFPRRRFTSRERRLIFDEAEPSGSSVDHLGEMEFDMNPYTDNVPEGAESDGKNMRDRVNEKYGGRKEKMSSRKFFAMLHGGVTNVLNGVIDQQQYRDARLRAGVERARAQGKYRRDAPEKVSTGYIEKDIEKFDTFIEDATKNIWRMPDMQNGLVKITTAMERAWNLVMDLIQVRGGLAANHELLRSDYWSGEKFSSGELRKGARIPGSYYDGRLSRIGSNVLGNVSQRALSGELDRFERKPVKDRQFSEVVPARYRGAVKSQSKSFFNDMSDIDFGRMKWNMVRQGDDITGQSHIFFAEKDAGKLDDSGTPLPGEEAFRGLVHVYGDYDNPESAEVVFVDFDDTNKMLHAMINDPVLNTLVTVPGFFSKGQAAKNKTLLALAKSTPPENRDLGFYENIEIGRLQKEETSLTYIIDALERAGITPEDLDGWMRTLNINGHEAQWEALAIIVHEDIHNGKELLWKRAFGSFLREAVVEQEKEEKQSDVGQTRADEWWENDIMELIKDAATP